MHLIFIVVQTQQVFGDTEGYITVISSTDYSPEKFPEMSIQIPSELIKKAANGSSDVVRVVSFLYFHVMDFFPSGKPGDNG